MASNTPNYNLKKPASTDFYNVEDQNTNMDKLDVALKGLADGKATITHAAQHAAGGSDPVTPGAIGAAEVGHTHTPAGIGAAPTVHTHDDRYFTEGESLSATTAALFGLGSGAVPNDVFSLMGGGYRNIGKFVYLEFLESQSWVAPSGIQNNEITVLCCGGGGAHGSSGSHGGGGSGYITRQKLAITPGASYNIIIGAGAGIGTAQGGTTSFGALASAMGGYSSSSINGGNGNAGGAAGYGGKGGNGGEFGGGGGSIGTESTSPGQGGNGGTYGGGGGGQPGGTGGTYGGNGGTLTVAAANGTPFNDPTNIYRENFPCLTGKAGSGNLAGGGGHGGVGGNGAYYSYNSYIRNIGGGGGGYGSYGGTPTSGLNNMPGSGGGYGGNGVASGSGASGGGGYFSAGNSKVRGAGGGGDTTTYSGGSGVCAIWYFKED